MLPNHSCFGAIEEEQILEGTRLLSTLEKINSCFLGKEFRKNCRRFLENLVSTIFSTVAVCSSVGRGFRCFCRNIIIGVDDYSAVHLFGQLLDGLLELGCVRVSEIETAKAELHFFVRKQRQVEVGGKTSRVLINSVFAFCNQTGFRSRRNLHKVSTMFLQNHFSLLIILHVFCFQVFQLTRLVVRGPSEVHPVFTVSLSGFAIDHEKVKGAVPCVQDFVRHPLFTQRNFFSGTGISLLNTVFAGGDAVRHSSEFDPWGAIRVEVGPVVADLESCRENVVSRRKAAKDTRERWLGAVTVASSAVGDAAPRTTVRISDVVEVGGVQYVEEHNKFSLPSCSRCVSSPGKSKKRRKLVGPVVAKKTIFG